MRAGLVVVLCLASASCAGDDPTGLFERSRVGPVPVVESETFDIDLDTLAEATADPETASPPAVEIPADALDRTGLPAVDIDIRDNVFEQRVIVVTAGTEITWTNQGRNEHNVRPAVVGAFESISAAALAVKGDAASLVFTEPGDYPYFCSLHGTATNGQTGRVIVVSPDSA